MCFSTLHEVSHAANIWSLYITKALLTSNTELLKISSKNTCLLMSVHGQLKIWIPTTLRSTWRGIRLRIIAIKAKYRVAELQPTRRSTLIAENVPITFFYRLRIHLHLRGFSKMKLIKNHRSYKFTNVQINRRTHQQTRLRQRPPVSLFRQKKGLTTFSLIFEAAAV